MDAQPAREHVATAPVHPRPGAGAPAPAGPPAPDLDAVRGLSPRCLASAWSLAAVVRRRPREPRTDSLYNGRWP